MTDARLDLPSAVGPWWGLRQEILVFAGCTAAAVLLVQGGGRVPFLSEHVHALAELTFLAVPWLLLERRGEDPDAYGFHLGRPGRSLLLVLAAMAVTFPPFLLGWVWWWAPSTAFDFGRLPADFWSLALAQFAVVALPEEALFRGYLQTRLERRFPSRLHRGLPVGWAIPLTSLAFALCHLAVIPHPARLAVFFPSLLFGLLRFWSGSLLAPVLFHGACNVLGDALYYGYFAP